MSSQSITLNITLFKHCVLYFRVTNHYSSLIYRIFVLNSYNFIDLLMFDLSIMQFIMKKANMFITKLLLYIYKFLIDAQPLSC